MAVNKVEINGEVKLDLTQDTVTAAKLAHGETAHDASGELITGTMTAPQLQIVVTASAGATITATKGSKTVSGVADADGQCTLIVDEVGTWTVVGTLGAQSATADVLIGEAAVALKMYVPVFADNDWSTIIEACQSGAVPDTWAVGDSKPMIINGTEYQIDILGKNHDDYYDGSGKAPLTFILHNCYDTRYQMNSSNSSSTKAWKNTRMRNTVLPSILQLMPEEVRSAIKQVSKTTGDGGENYATYSATAETLFLLSQSEVFRVWGTESTEEGQPYLEYFGQGSSAAIAAKKIKKSRTGEARKWWTRTAYTGTGYYYCIVSDEGYEQDSGGTATYGVVFAFCF